MPVEWTNEEFNRVGRKTEGEGDSKYLAKQLVKGTIRTDSVENFVEDVLTVCDGDLSKAGPYFESGANHHIRLEAGGYDEWQKTAKMLKKSGLPQFKALTVEQIVELLKTQANQ